MIAKPHSPAPLCLLLMAALCWLSCNALWAQDDEVNKVVKDLEKDERVPPPDTSEKDTSYWHFKGITNLNGSQISLTNWAGGGQNSIAGHGLVSLHADYAKDGFTFNNTADLAYGKSRQGDLGWIKTDDKIDFSSKVGYRASKNWKYSFLLGFSTRFEEGFKNPTDQNKTSDFLAPAYVTTSLGMDLNPRDYFSLLLSPATIKITIVNSPFLANQGAYGVEEAIRDTAGNILAPGSRQRFETGGLVKAQFNREIWTNVTLNSKITLFSNYSDEPQNIDISSEVLFDFKVNKYITANISGHLIYDDDIVIKEDTNGDGELEPLGPRIQFKQRISIGFSYSFDNRSS